MILIHEAGRFGPVDLQQLKRAYAMSFMTKDKLLDALLSSPAAKAVAEKHASEIAGRRTELAEKLKALEKEASETFLRGEKAQAAAYNAVLGAEKAYREAKERLAKLLAERSAESWRLGHAIEGCEAELRETASPAIGDFILEMRELHDETLKVLNVPEGIAVRNRNTGRMVYERGPRRIQPADRAQAIREVIAKAEALKLEAKQDNVANALSALRQSLPVIGEIYDKTSH